MKRKNCIFLLALILSFVLTQRMFAQEMMEVVSLTRIDNDLRAQMSEKVYDEDGEICALIIVETNLSDLVFDPDGRGIVEKVNKTGEIWLYVPYGARQMYIKHNDYYPVQYTYELPIERGIVYRLRLKAYSSGEKAVNSNQQLLIIHPEPKNARVFIDNEEMEVKDGSMSIMMKKGEHIYRVEAPDYDYESGTIVLGDEMVSKTVSLKPRFGFLDVHTLPTDSVSVFVNDDSIGITPIRNYKLPIDKYRISLRKDFYHPLDSTFYISPGDTTIQSYTVISTIKPGKFPTRLSAEYTFTGSSYHGLRVAYGGQIGVYLSYKWGEYNPAGVNIDNYANDADVSHAKELGYIRKSYTGGIQFGLNKKKIPLYVYVGGGYGEYGRQWENPKELDSNIYFHSDYIKGVCADFGLSCVLLDYISLSAGADALFGDGKVSVDYQIGVGLSFDMSRLFNRKK